MEREPTERVNIVIVICHRNTLGGTFQVFPRWEPANPSEVGVHFPTFFEALNSDAIDTDEL